VSARNRELLALIPASMLVTGGFAAVFIQRQAVLSSLSLTYGAIFLGLCIAVHIVLRVTLPHADPYLFPLVALLSCFGLVMVYRINETLARQQAQWFVLGLIAFAATVVLLRDYRKLERYRYTAVIVGIGLLLAPRALGQSDNGAYIAVHLGTLSFQPTEFTKIAMVIFLASYLHDTRHVLVLGARRVLGVTVPPLRHFGPLLAVWGLAMAIMLVVHDVGSSLMFFGALLALLYVATSRASFVAVGGALFAGGAWLVGTHVAHIRDRVQAWLHPFSPALYNRPGGSYQVGQSLFAQADGGLFGTGFAQALLKLPGGGTIIPAPQTDLIYAVITNELGLAGATAVILIYAMIVQRGLKCALLARDSFGTLLAVGLTTVVALQVFVIVGGVTKVIPLTGVTLPWISYGGSSIVANFVVLGLLLSVSDRARRPA